MGRPAPGPRPDGDGLEGAPVLPRGARPRRSSTATATPGTTAWWDGRIVGCWVQDPDGVVVRLRSLEDAGSDARAALDREAERLTTWLAGERVGTVYPSPAMKTRTRRGRPDESRPARAAGTPGAAAAAAVRQAGPAALHQPPRLQPRLRAGAVRARVPMAYSSGFNPHPRISYAGAAPTGLGQRGRVPRDRPGRGRRPGRRCARCSPRRCPPASTWSRSSTSPRPGALADLLEASRWRIETDLAREAVARAVEPSSRLESVVVERMTKKGLREFDCRAAVLDLRRRPDGERGATPRPGAAPRRAGGAPRRRADRAADVAGLRAADAVRC